MAGIGIITNPHSKMNKRRPHRGRLLGYIVGQFGSLEVTSSIDDIGRVASLFKEQCINTLAINGGDGTISRTLTAFYRVYGPTPLPEILVLRGGTINMLADNLGLRGSPEEILVRFLESQSGLRAKKIKMIATLSIGGQFGFIFGNGLVARYLTEFYKNKTGALGAVFLIARIYFDWIFAPRRYKEVVASESYRILFDGHEHYGPQKSVAMMASTVARMPLGFRLFPNINNNLSHFQFFSLEMSERSLPLRLPWSFLKNRPGRFLGKYTRMASGAVISHELGKQSYTLDGEIFDAPSGRLAVGVGPVVQFVVV